MVRRDVFVLTRFSPADGARVGAATRCCYSVLRSGERSNQRGERGDDLELVPPPPIRKDSLSNVPTERHGLE